MAKSRRRSRKTKVQAKNIPTNVRVLDSGRSAETDAILDQHNIDLTNDAYEVDFELVSEKDSENSGTPVDFNFTRDLVPVPDNTLIREKTANRQLVKMNDQEIKANSWLLNRRIIYPEMDDYAIMNSFREIRTRLLQKSKGKNFIVMVVSLNQEMGASFTSVNLGAAFAYEGAKTSLLIDCNPLERKLSNLLGLKEYTGLSDYIIDPDVNAMDIIYPVGISRMRAIPFGTALKSRLEFIGSDRLKEFLGIIKRRHIDRYIIINAPPLEISADAAILSELTDYVIVVVPYGRITKRRLSRAIKSIPAEKLAGIVLNNCKKYV